MNYVTWALIGMAGYSATTLLVKLATRDGRFSSFLVLAIASAIVFSATLVIVGVRGDLARVAWRDFAGADASYAYATGIALSVAVMSLFRALSLGPASTVVPIYGMFIVGGAVLGFVFLHEPVTWRKLAGIGCAIASIVLLARR